MDVGGGSNDLRAADEAHYTPPWGIVGEAAALGRMRKDTSPSSEPAAASTTSMERSPVDEDDEEDPPSPTKGGRQRVPAAPVELGA